MSGNPARSLFVDKAMLAASTHQRSTTAYVMGAVIIINKMLSYRRETALQGAL